MLKTTIEYLTELDSQNRQRFFLNWIDQETGKNRSQVYFADPLTYGHDRKEGKFNHPYGGKYK